MKKPVKNCYENFTLKVSGRKWKIIFAPVPKHLIGEEEHLGLFAADLDTLWVTPEQTHNQLVHTCIHEIIHLGMRNIAGGDKLDQECVADCIAELLAEIFPQLSKKAPWLLKGFLNE